MKTIKPTRTIPHSNAEICLNLWYFTDDSQTVQRIAGKAYALTGNDKEKLSTLQGLAGTDHLTATHDSVPTNIKCLNSEGKFVDGVVTAADIFLLHSTVFEKLMDKIERQLPPGIKAIEDKYVKFEHKISNTPLCVTTAVYQTKDGTLVALPGEQP